MKHKNPSLENKREIAKHMSQTFYNRRNWILQDQPTVTQVIESYPRLASYDGDIVCVICPIIYRNPYLCQTEIGVMCKF